MIQKQKLSDFFKKVKAKEKTREKGNRKIKRKLDTYRKKRQSQNLTKTTKQ